jgi:hypothetical protein
MRASGTTQAMRASGTKQALRASGTTHREGGDEMTEPLFRVAHGNPSGEETAALAVVLAAKLAAGPPTAHGPARRRLAGRWADRARSMRAPLAPGPDAWRRSGQPR